MATALALSARSEKTRKEFLKMEFNPQWERSQSTPVSTFVVDTVLEELDIAAEEMVDPSLDADDSYEQGFNTLQLCMNLMRTHDCGEFSDIETEIISNTFNTAIITMAHSIMDMEDC
jgi:hypothetical protein